MASLQCWCIVLAMLLAGHASLMQNSYQDQEVMLFLLGVGCEFSGGKCKIIWDNHLPKSIFNILPGGEVWTCWKAILWFEIVFHFWLSFLFGCRSFGFDEFSTLLPSITTFCVLCVIYCKSHHHHLMKILHVGLMQICWLKFLF